jgi:hypothetical protein
MSAAAGDSTAVTDNASRQRFELQLAGGTAFVDYHYRDGGDPDSRGRVRVLTHAEVPVPLRGAGVGAQLVGGALDLMRSRGEKVVPSCPFVARFIQRHAQYADLQAQA